MSRVILKPGKERSVMQRHPWVFAGSVERLEGRARPGDTVEVQAADGRMLGRGAWSPESQIRVRMWNFGRDAASIDHAFFKRVIAAAVARRVAHPLLAGQSAMRLLHGEADGLPGVIADRYGDVIVIQLTSAGADKWRAAIVSGLVQATNCATVYERSDSEVRGLEGLEAVVGCAHGELPETLAIEENGVRMGVDVVGGHKTGFYLDQRDNRLLTGRLSAGRRVLNCFCYSGGFSLQALAGGASAVVSIDSSGPALDAARSNLAMNPSLDATRAEWRQADVFEALRELKTAGEKFDLIVLDPPKFAPSAAHADRAARAYKDINLFGFRLLSPGGLLMTYSCSGGIGSELFQKIVAGAAVDAGVDGRILQRLSAGPDHPVGLAAPEGEYLKGLVVQID